MGWGTGFARKYSIDPFFRTEVNIIALQLLFSLAVVALIGVALTYLYQSTLTTILARIQEAILNAPEDTKGALPVIVPSFGDIQSGTLFAIIGASVLLTLAFGYLMTRIALEPTKNALASQKQFIGNIAHEIRTPLSILKANTEIRLMDAEVPKEARELHQSNLEELDRISNIINNLLTLNTLVRPEHIEFSEVDFGEVVDEAYKKLATAMRQKGVTFTLKKSDMRVVWGNRTALEQIVINILKNAITYTPPGGTIAVTLEHDHKSIVLTIKDSGAGIAEKDLFRIFEPYYKGDESRTRKKTGSGLGLAIVSELVRLHRGTVNIQSALRRGTTVTVSIPTPDALGHTQEKSVKPKTTTLGEVRIDFSNKKP